MTKIKIQFKNDKKVIGRTSKKFPEVVQGNETVYGIEVESGTMSRVVKIDKLDNDHSHLYFITKNQSDYPRIKKFTDSFWL